MFGRLVSAALPLVPRRVVERVAKRYIAGETTDQALQTVSTLNARGFDTTLDILGEDTLTRADAKATRDAYIALLRHLGGASVHAGVSLKLTALGLRVDRDLALRHLQEIVHVAADARRFVRIDMEQSALTTATLAIYNDLRQGPHAANVGAVLQAYLRRTHDDIEALLASNGPLPNIRLCKGIYREPADVAFPDPARIVENFITSAQRLLSAGAFVGLATHDRALIEPLAEWVQSAGIPSSQYEFQALLGVPIEGLLDRLVADGHRVRVYVPFGGQWYAYSTRRLRENPEMAGHVVKAMFRRLD